MSNNQSAQAASELLKLQTNAEEDPNKEKSSQLVERQPVGQSILSIVGNREKGYALVIGKHRITDWKDSIEEVENYMVTEFWHVVTMLIATMQGIDEERRKSEDQLELFGDAK